MSIKAIDAEIKRLTKRAAKLRKKKLEIMQRAKARAKAKAEKTRG